MIASLTPDALRDYVHRLVAHHLPDGYMPNSADMRVFSIALERLEHCFSHIHRKYYVEAGEPVFDHLNGDHMATLLYFYANSVWRESGDIELPTRLFYLNKILHGLDLFYSVSMPEIFLLVHPLGSVLGNAKYEDYLVIYQNCTVGAVTDVYPCFGRGTILYSRSSVIGDCVLGHDVVIAANTFIIDRDVPSNSVVVGQYPALRLLPNARSVRERCFDAIGTNQ
jgi:serine O-acetyltransferase